MSGDGVRVSKYALRELCVQRLPELQGDDHHAGSDCQL